VHLTSLMIALFPFLKELKVVKEKRTGQSTRTVVPHPLKTQLTRPQLDSSPVLTHQSKSYPGQARLARTPSMSSQSSLDSSISGQVNNIEILCSVDRASLYNLVNEANLVHNLFLVYLSVLHVSGDYVPIIRRNNCVYATLGTCYSAWMAVWYAGWNETENPAYQAVFHTE